MINLRVGCALLMATGLVLLPVSGFAGNSDFSAGTSFGRSNGNVTKAEMEKAGNNIGEYVPEFDRGKAEQQYGGYYGGVKGGGRDMNAPGSEQFNSTEWGKAIQENKRKAPDMPGVSPGDEFLKQGQKAIDNAQNMFDPNMCKSVSFDKITTLKKTCERDLEVAQSCTRTASITGHYENTTVTRTYTVPNSEFSYTYDGNKTVNLRFRAPATGTVLSASVAVHFNDRNMLYDFWWWGANQNSVKGRDNSWSLPGAAGTTLTAGQYSPQGGMLNKNCLSGKQSRCQEYARKTLSWMQGGTQAWMTVTLTMRVTDKKWVPDVVWNESCPFSKSEGALIKSECKVPGGTKTVVVDGVSYPVTQPCWQYEDTYRSQSATEGTCGSLNNDRACTRIGVECQDMNEGICYSQKEIWQCQSPSTGKGQICGDELFCQDGTCVESQTKTNNRFAEAVSALAMLAAAGEDAKGDSMNIRVFTGKPQSCRKAMAGFNNCCQSGGWGGDVGLAHCSDEEKALGKAREKGITIQVGTYCSNKVLGVCLQKKTSYCVFDSKLAKIAQEQGRGGQLGIGFGGASSPDCRGMTVEELSRLRFDNMDFSSFFDELSSKSNVPQDQQLLDRVSNSLKGFTGKYDPDKNQNPSIPIN